MLTLRLYQEVSAACPILGVTVKDTSDRTTWDIQFQPSATAEQRAAASQVVNSYIDTSEADAEWEKATATTEAVQWLAGSGDFQAVALRVVLRDIYTQLNDGRERDDLPRIQEPNTAQRLIASAGQGAGEPIGFG